MLCSEVPEYNFTKTEFVEMRMVVSSRCFGLTMNGEKTDVLVPYADFLNHVDTEKEPV